MNRRRIQALLFLLGLALSLMGCSTTDNQNGRSALAVEPVPAAPLPPLPPPQEGSLWSDKSSQGLLTDLRAANVGDLVTISITESAKAGHEAKTKASKTSGIKVGIASLFGLSLPSQNMFMDNQATASTAMEGGVGNTSDGQGTTTRQSSFTTYISAQVIQLLPNRNLVIQGKRHIKINNETEVVTITGVIRPTDLDRTNTVPSTMVANARLEITGYGVVADKQRQGWFTRILDHIWPW